MAAHMLLAWLLALAAGVVNACLAEPQLAHGISVATDLSGTHRHGPSQAAKAPCAKFCSEASAGSQASKPQVDPGVTSLAPPPAPWVPDSAVAAVKGAFARDTDSPPRTVPIAIAFLRLTL